MIWPLIHRAGPARNADLRARAVIAPNPLEAPVTRTTFGVLISDHPSVGIDDLAVDPPGGTGQERRSEGARGHRAESARGAGNENNLRCAHLRSPLRWDR